MEELGKNTKNIFGRIANVPKLIKRDLKELEKKSTTTERKLTFAEGQQVEGLYRADLDKTHEKLMGLVEGIRNADANLYINSSEFKNMRNAAYALDVKQSLFSIKGKGVCIYYDPDKIKTGKQRRKKICSMKL